MVQKHVRRRLGEAQTHDKVNQCSASLKASESSWKAALVALIPQAGGHWVVQHCGSFTFTSSLYKTDASRGWSK